MDVDRFTNGGENVEQ